MKGALSTFKTTSQCGRILAHLKTGATLTCYEAMIKGFGMNLRSRISNIRDAGYNIKSEQVKFNGGFVAQYSLEGVKDES